MTSTQDFNIQRPPFSSRAGTNSGGVVTTSEDAFPHAGDAQIRRRKVKPPVDETTQPSMVGFTILGGKSAYKDLHVQLDVQLAAWKALQSGGLNAFNKRLQEANVTPVDLQGE